MSGGTPRRGPSRRVRRNRTFVVGGLILILVVTIVTTTLLSEKDAATVVPSATDEATPNSNFNKQLLSLDDPSSIWVVVDKIRPLNPKNYVAADLVTLPVLNANPSKLRREASEALETMFAAYTAETGLKMASQSAYRSYPDQVSIYNSNVDRLGQTGADLASARGGFSEHQTGLALDIAASPANCTLDVCFATTPQGQWLATNSWRYGWILRYPEGETDVTGYQFEPWHYRYIGIDASTQYHDEGATTLEGFFGLPAAPDYATKIE
jgi:zinc D-Ala-D-Ala carboxypeptidase